MMDSIQFRRRLIFGLGACAAAAGAWYLTRQECSCGECTDADTTVYLVENGTEWRAMCEEIVWQIQRSKVVALDCEWVTASASGSSSSVDAPNIMPDDQIAWGSGGRDGGRGDTREAGKGRRKIALLQLATSPGWVALIRLSKMRGVPDELAQLLKDPSIVKVGVAVLDDAAKILDDYKVQVNGCLDLRYMALATPKIKKALLEANASLSLASMTEALLQTQMLKDPEVRCSDWECPELTSEQVSYASYDVVCAFELAELIARSNDWVTRVIGWMLPSHLWLDSYLLSQYSEFIGIPFRRRQAALKKRSASGTLLAAKQAAVVDVDVVSTEEKTLRAYSTRKTPLYDNCVLLCPDGEKLCTCDRRKAQWYVERGLGQVVDEDPLTVQLSFEPSQRAILDGEYYSTAKENVCVVCGSKDDLVRKSVVPKEYRRYFPKIMKHHNAHDVVLTCLRCHSKSCLYDNVLKERLAHECDAPLSSSTIKYRENPDLKAVRYAANALLKNSTTLPEGRRLELENQLRQELNVDQLTDELLESASKIDAREKNENYVSHGRKVVERFAASEGGLIRLETMWRQHFLEKMAPANLPPLWSTDHHHEVLAVKLAFIRDCDADSANDLMARIGLSNERVDEILSKLRDEDKVKVDKMSIKKGRLVESLSEQSND